MSDYQNDYIVKRLGRGPYILAELTGYIQNQECLTCHEPLHDIQAYPHSAGIEIQNLLHTHWVYSECWSCGYPNALWKLCAVDLDTKIQMEIHGVNGL